MGGHIKPYITVVVVWVVSSFGLALAASSSISFAVFSFAALLLVLAVADLLVHKVHRKDLDNRELAKKLLADFQSLAGKVSKDFGAVLAGISDWWLRRETRIQEEMAQEHERQAQRRERLVQLEHKRSTRPANEHPTAKEHEYAQKIQRRLQERRAED